MNGLPTIGRRLSNAVFSEDPALKKYMRCLAPVLISAIFVLAVYLLYQKLKVYSLAQIKASIEHIPYWRLGLSLLLAAVNYVILIATTGWR